MAVHFAPIHANIEIIANPARSLRGSRNHHLGRAPIEYVAPIAGSITRRRDDPRDTPDLVIFGRRQRSLLRVRAVREEGEA